MCRLWILDPSYRLRRNLLSSLLVVVGPQRCCAIITFNYAQYCTSASLNCWMTSHRWIHLWVRRWVSRVSRWLAAHEHMLTYAAFRHQWPLTIQSTNDPWMESSVLKHRAIIGPFRLPLLTIVPLQKIIFIMVMNRWRNVSGRGEDVTGDGDVDNS